jgi:hypothetical protein
MWLMETKVFKEQSRVLNAQEMVLQEKIKWKSQVRLRKQQINQSIQRKQLQG